MTEQKVLSDLDSRQQTEDNFVDRKIGLQVKGFYQISKCKLR